MDFLDQGLFFFFKSIDAYPLAYGETVLFFVGIGTKLVLVV